jgi:hypothetical protein
MKEYSYETVNAAYKDDTQKMLDEKSKAGWILVGSHLVGATPFTSCYICYIWERKAKI